MPLSWKQRFLLRIAAWALRTYMQTRKPSPLREPASKPLPVPPRLESSRQTTPQPRVTGQE